MLFDTHETDEIMGRAGSGGTDQPMAEAVSQWRWGEARRASLGGLSKMPDIVASADQIREAVLRAQTLSEDLHGWEWATTHRRTGWSNWATDHKPDQSTVWSDGDMSIHAHIPTASRQQTETNYYPGPLDHVPTRDFHKPSFIFTPDRNTLLQFGVRNHAYFVEPVWQRPGTVNSRDYGKWQATGTE